MLEKLPTDISLVSDQFPIDFTQKALVLQWFPVVDISAGDAEVEDLAFLIAYDMQFETEEPSHRALAPGGYSLEHLMHVNPLVPTYTQWSAVHEGNAGALATENLLDEQGQGKGHIFLQLYETVIRHYFRKEMTQVLADILQIEMFQAPIAGIVEEYHDDHYLGVAEGGRTVIRASRRSCLVLYGVFFDG